MSDDNETRGLKAEAGEWTVIVIVVGAFGFCVGRLFGWW